MNDPIFRALVVDDEPALRNLTIRALQREGFSCDAAADGLEAEKLIAAQTYDIVVTDLKMPNMNGHALACEVLQMNPRPLVVVLTGVLEPRLTKDLTVRGVDSIEFKPVNPLLFAAKIKALVDRRRRQFDADQPDQAFSPSKPHEPCLSVEQGVHQNVAMIRKGDLQAKLIQISKILPISQAAMDVFNMTNAETCENSQIAAATARDPSLSLDILKLANSSFYNISRKKVTGLDEAILLLGQKRVGELALATSAMTAMTTTLLPWINTTLTWQRSVAAGVAVDLMLSDKGIPGTENQLFLSAILHPLGRIALGMLYPEKYVEIIKNCRERRLTIEDQERAYFPMTPEDVLCDLMKIWNIPDAISEPLRYSSHPYRSLSLLGEPLETQVELLKMAVFIARIAVDQWESYDRIDLPPEPVLNHLGVNSYAEIIRNTRLHTEEILRACKDTSSFEDNPQETRKSAQFPHPISYCNLSSDTFDFLGAILNYSGILLQDYEMEMLSPDVGILVNCIGCPAHRLVARLLLNHHYPKLHIITTTAQAENYSRFGQVLSLPANYGSLQEVYEKIAGCADDRPRNNVPTHVLQDC